MNRENFHQSPRNIAKNKMWEMDEDVEWWEDIENFQDEGNAEASSELIDQDLDEDEIPFLLWVSRSDLLIRAIAGHHAADPQTKSWMRDVHEHWNITVSEYTPFHTSHRKQSNPSASFALPKEISLPCMLSTTMDGRIDCRHYTKGHIIWAKDLSSPIAVAYGLNMTSGGLVEIQLPERVFGNRDQSLRFIPYANERYSLPWNTLSVSNRFPTSIKDKFDASPQAFIGVTKGNIYAQIGKVLTWNGVNPYEDPYHRIGIPPVKVTQPLFNPSTGLSSQPLSIPALPPLLSDTEQDALCVPGIDAFPNCLVGVFNITDPVIAENDNSLNPTWRSPGRISPNILKVLPKPLRERQESAFFAFQLFVLSCIGLIVVYRRSFINTLFSMNFFFFLFFFLFLMSFLHFILQLFFSPLFFFLITFDTCHYYFPFLV